MTKNRPIAVILLAFVLLSLISSVINPLHESTDELRHYRFVRYLSVYKSLPVQGEIGCSVQGHHPPLFYLLAAAATGWIDTGREICYAPPSNQFWGYRYWEVGSDNKNQYLHGQDEEFPWHGEALAAHLARVVNIVIGAGVVLMTWLIGRSIWPRRPGMALGGVAFVAFNPMFVYMAGSINNDVIAALAGSAVTLACIRLIKDEAGLRLRWGIALGVLYGLALMSKFSLAAIIVLIESTVTWVAWQKRQWRLWWSVNLLIFLSAAVLAGWWFVRNLLLYGEPTGFQKVTELWGARDPLESWGVAVFELPYTWTSLWGRFGYGQIPLPDGIYLALQWMVAFAFLGLLIGLVRRLRLGIRPQLAPFHLLLLNVLIFFGVLFAYMLLSPAGAMGRFFFPALPTLGILIFVGLHQWVEFAVRSNLKRRQASSYPTVSAAAANSIMLLLTLVALFAYLAPAFALPPEFTASDTPQHRLDVQFDTLVKLHGFDISTISVHAGEAIEITLYWEVIGQPPGNYLLFVHLVDGVGTMVAQRDTHPGLGNFPTSEWRPGDRFVETIRLIIPETAYTSSAAVLTVGLYDPDGFRLAITDSARESLGDSLELGSITVEPFTQDYPNPLRQNFNNQMMLVGYEYDRRLLDAEDDLTVTLYWKALQSSPPDYLVRVQLVDESGAIFATVTDRPQSGQSPTSNWQVGQIVSDAHLLDLDPALPASTYRIHVALIDAVSKEAQNIVADDGHWIDDHIELAGLRRQ